MSERSEVDAASLPEPDTALPSLEVHLLTLHCSNTTRRAVTGPEMASFVQTCLHDVPSLTRPSQPWHGMERIDLDNSFLHTPFGTKRWLETRYLLFGQFLFHVAGMTGEKVPCTQHKAACCRSSFPLPGLCGLIYISFTSSLGRHVPHVQFIPS